MGNGHLIKIGGYLRYEPSNVESDLEKALDEFGIQLSQPKIEDLDYLLNDWSFLEREASKKLLTVSYHRLFSPDEEYRRAVLEKDHFSVNKLIEIINDQSRYGEYVNFGLKNKEPECGFEWEFSMEFDKNKCIEINPKEPLSWKQWWGLWTKNIRSIMKNYYNIELTSKEATSGDYLKILGKKGVKFNNLDIFRSFLRYSNNGFFFLVVYSPFMKDTPSP